MKLCPICTIVSGSWLMLLAYRAAGYAVDPALIATLMGGSAVGVTYLLERRLPHGRSPMWFKLLTVPPLLASVYSVAAQRWLVAVGAFAVGGGLIAFFFRQSANAQPETVAAAEKKLENCC